MKKKNTFLSVLLNVVFCAALLWVFTRNSFLRPFSGSQTREFLMGVVLLGILYANFFLLYPKLYGRHPVLYCAVVAAVSLLSGLLEIAVAHKNIESCCAPVIQAFGPFNYYAKVILFVAGRNLAFNLFPFLLRERQHLRQDLDEEIQVVYKEARMLDVIDTNRAKKCHLVPIDDIYYCEQSGNFTSVHMVQDNCYTRLGSMRHLEQLVGTDNFIRISSSLLLPYRHIKSCNGSEVFMKKTPWIKDPGTFKIDPKSCQEVSEAIFLHFQEVKILKKREMMERARKKRNPIKPSPEKIETVLLQIQRQPGCRANGIADQTQYSLSTVERCLSELRKRGLVEFRGSKKKGGYWVVES
ncbi:MAG: LytTR family transcriptional regulator DNA-binding domain-containing protein [Bacteroidales bacterium]|nr:LytTR family transcriptional regulator DNA-binding domain-containing protein [Bacteroidales bacterium]